MSSKYHGCGVDFGLLIVFVDRLLLFFFDSNSTDEKILHNPAYNSDYGFAAPVSNISEIYI